MMVLVLPSPPPPRFPPSSFFTANLPARVFLTPPLSSSLFVCCYAVLPPGAPVVTCRPLVWLTGGRFHVVSASRCFMAFLPNLCSWWYLARVLVEGRRRRRPPRWSWVPWHVNRRRPACRFFSVSGPGRHAQIRRCGIEQIRCSTLFHPWTVATPSLVSGCPARVYARQSFQRSCSLVDFLGAHLSVCPPPPPSMYNRTCPNTVPPNGRGFLWLPRSTSPCRSPLARTFWWPKRLLVPVPCPPPLPIPLPCLCPGPVAPYRAFCSGLRSVGETAPRAWPTGPGYHACKPRDQKISYWSNLVRIW